MPTVITSDQLVEGYRKYPIDDHGKLRIEEFQISALAVALAAGDQIDLFKFAPARKRLLPNLSRIACSAFGAGRTLHIGHRAYQSRPLSMSGAVLEAENATAFVNALDVSGALNSAVWSTVLKYDMSSVDEITVFAQVNVNTMPIGATLSGFAIFVYE